MPVLKHNEDESKFYKAQITETTEQINDMENEFLRDKTTYNGSNSSIDLWNKYLTEQGSTVSPSTKDKWAEFLIAQGYLSAGGNLQDAQIKYFKANS